MASLEARSLMAGRGLSRENVLYECAQWLNHIKGYGELRNSAELSNPRKASLRAAALRYSAELLRKTAEHNTQDAALLLEQLADEQE